MKAPSKTKRMKKYMILFSILLFIVVLSIVLAFFVGTKDVMDDIPQKVGEEFKVLPAVQNMDKLDILDYMKISLDNLTVGQKVLNKGSRFHCRTIGAQKMRISISFT